MRFQLLAAGVALAGPAGGGPTGALDSGSQPRILIASWPFALAFWLVFAVTFFPEWRLMFRTRRKARPGPQDAGSIRVIMAGNTLSQWGALAAVWLCPWAAIVRHQLVAFWSGVLLLACGAILRRHCFRMLGDSFTGSVLVHPGQQIVQRGAYRWVRHPSYSAAFLVMGGIGLALTNWISLVILLGISTPVYGYRVWVEERALVETLGEPYRAYMRKTKRFVPFII